MATHECTETVSFIKGMTTEGIIRRIRQAENTIKEESFVIRAASTELANRYADEGGQNETTA